MITVLSVLCSVTVDRDDGGTDVISKLDPPKEEDVAVLESGAEDFSVELLELFFPKLELIEAELVVEDGNEVDKVFETGLLPLELADFDIDVLLTFGLVVKEELDENKLDLEGKVSGGAEDSFNEDTSLELVPVELSVLSSKGQ